MREGWRPTWKMSWGRTALSREERYKEGMFRETEKPGEADNLKLRTMRMPQKEWGQQGQRQQRNSWGGNHSWHKQVKMCWDWVNTDDSHPRVEIRKKSWVWRAQNQLWHWSFNGARKLFTAGGTSTRIHYTHLYNINYTPGGGRSAQQLRCCSGYPHSTPECLGSRSGSISNPSFLLMCTMGSSWWQLTHKGDPDWVMGYWLWSTLQHLLQAFWGMNQETGDRSSPPPPFFPLSLAALEIST